MRCYMKKMAIRRSKKRLHGEEKNEYTGCNGVSHLKTIGTEEKKKVKMTPAGCIKNLNHAEMSIVTIFGE